MYSKNQSNFIISALGWGNECIMYLCYDAVGWAAGRASDL